MNFSMMEIHNYRTFPCLESDLNISEKFIYKYMYMELHIILSLQTRISKVYSNKISQFKKRHFFTRIFFYMYVRVSITCMYKKIYNTYKYYIKLLRKFIFSSQNERNISYSALPSNSRKSDKII